MRRTIVYGMLLLVLVLLLSFSYIIFKTFTKETFHTLIGLKKRYLFISILFLLLYHTFDNIRLFLLSRAVRLRYSFVYGYITSFVNTFGATVTPAHLGGELIAIYMLMRKGGSVHKVMSVVTMKTISGLAFFLLYLPLLVWQLKDRAHQVFPVLEILLIVSLVFGGAYLGVNALIRKNRETPSVKKILKGLKRYATYMKIYGYKRKKYFALSVLSSVALYISFLLIAPALLKAFGKDVDPLELLLAQIGLLYAIFVSPTPGGSGVGELGGLVVFASFLEPFEVGVFVIIWRFFSQYLSATLGGILFLLCLIKDLRR